MLAGLVNGLSAWLISLSRMSASISAMVFTVYPLIVLGFLARERFTCAAGAVFYIAGYLLVVPAER
jgi:hypothetical protein